MDLTTANLRTERLRRGISQARLAAAVGRTQSEISALEHADERIRELAAVLEHCPLVCGECHRTL